jgi:hypothetical protein
MREAFVVFVFLMNAYFPLRYLALGGDPGFAWRMFDPQHTKHCTLRMEDARGVEVPRVTTPLDKHVEMLGVPDVARRVVEWHCTQFTDLVAIRGSLTCRLYRQPDRTLALGDDPIDCRAVRSRTGWR